MIFLYNIILFIALVISLPIIIIKSLINPRFRYKIKDRFIPSYKITKDNYLLIHASSFGEAKTLNNIIRSFEKQLNKISVFSLFTDTGYVFMNNNRQAFIMPVDIYPLYKRIFRTPPHLAMFFETEIWPSYITFLKNKGVKLALINARMSDKSFKLYKSFSFLFKNIIGKFDIIIAKSEEDAKKFIFFNTNTVVCGNLKQIKQATNVSENEKKATMKRFFIHTNKPIFTFGSVHKEEIDFIIHALSKLQSTFFIIVAPRHKEYADKFYNEANKIACTTKRSQHRPSCDILILDTMGELENLYKISDIIFIGGSTNNHLKGHNPVEPLAYNKFIICGPYMESFKNEVEILLKNNLITITNNIDKLTEIAIQYINNKICIDSSSYFNKFSDILDCYISHLKKYEK